MSPLRWRYAFFIGLISYAASLAAPIVDTFVPVLLQAGHPFWQNDTGLELSLTGFALGQLDQPLRPPVGRRSQ